MCHNFLLVGRKEEKGGGIKTFSLPKIFGREKVLISPRSLQPLQANKPNLMPNKNPFAGAIINFFFWGLGYVYCQKRSFFGYIVFIGFIFVHLPLLYGVNWLDAPGIFICIGHIVISFAFAIDIIESARIKSSKREQIESDPYVLAE